MLMIAVLADGLINPLKQALYSLYRRVQTSTNDADFGFKLSLYTAKTSQYN
jgi:hypothetical protein